MIYVQNNCFACNVWNTMWQTFRPVKFGNDPTVQEQTEAERNDIQYEYSVIKIETKLRTKQKSNFKSDDPPSGRPEVNLKRNWKKKVSNKFQRKRNRHQTNWLEQIEGTGSF